MGIASLVIMVSQLVSTFQTSKGLSDDIKHLREEIAQVKHEHAKYFVKKEELRTVVKKLDHMAGELVRINDQIERLRDTAFFDLETSHECSSPYQKALEVRL